MSYGTISLAMVLLVFIVVLLYLMQQKRDSVKARNEMYETRSSEVVKVADIMSIVEIRIKELSKQPYLASRVTYIEDIVRIGPSAIKPALELASDAALDNDIVLLELLASVVEIMNGHKKDSLVKQIIAEIGGYGTWDKHIGSDKNELLLQWWKNVNS